MPDCRRGVQTNAMMRSVKRIPSLDGLRAISIFLVVVGHWLTIRNGSPAALSYAILGVRIFFIISGYLITSLLLQERAKTGAISLRKFYVRRAYRILPAATAFMLPMMIIRRHDLTWYHAAAAALYLADFDPTKPLFLGHLWSLSVEEQFYLVWPGVLRKWHKHRIAILLTVVAFAPVYQVICYALHVRHFDHHFFAVADSLAIGCLTAILAPRLPRIKTWLGWAMLAPILFTPVFFGTSRIRTLLLLFLLWPLTYVSIAGILLRVVQKAPRLLNLGPVVWLGQISYSLYLWQQIFVFDANRRPWYFVLFAVGMASLSYYLIEQPMLRLRDRGASAKRSEAPLIRSEEPAA